MKNTYICSVEKPEAKRQLETSSGKWGDKLKMNLRNTGWQHVDRIHKFRTGRSDRLL
jgi:hypothetical protein